MVFKLLPLTEDMMKLNVHLDSEKSKQTSVLEEHIDNAEATLIQVVLAKVVNFNRKWWQGEVSKILLKEWNSKCTANPNTELETSLSEVEKACWRYLSILRLGGRGDELSQF